MKSSASELSLSFFIDASDEAEAVEAILKLDTKISDERDTRHLSHILKRREICRAFHVPLGAREPAGPDQRAGPFRPISARTSSTD